ncbi:protein CDC73 [Sesamum angolense]|uniref:Protein CDC73 n=1 Tax=Sesamum angolense TaxID=2727404 RepID=A0AAE1X5V9_9LAMI|nr:protein CDC73 [Sesamum angolense]
MEALQRKDNIVAKNRIESRGFGVGEEATKMRKIGEGVPIILVPSAFSTLITIYNVKEFLEDGVFIPTDVKLKQVKGGKPDCVTVQKKFSRDRVVQAYEVRDKPSALKSDDWDRVVAVFVLGKEWQFKDWPFKDHVEIFNKILGFYMRFEDDSVESAKTVKQWNVKIISISKNKRHQDRAAALEFRKHQNTENLEEETINLSIVASHLVKSSIFHKIRSCELMAHAMVIGASSLPFFCCGDGLHPGNLWRALGRHFGCCPGMPLLAQAFLGLGPFGKE